MKKNDFGQIKTMDIKELMVKAVAIKAEMPDLILDKNMNKLKDLKKISKKRKDLAQMLTVLKQKELLQELESRIQKDDSSESVIAIHPKPLAKEEKQSKKEIATSPLVPRNDKNRRSKKS